MFAFPLLLTIYAGFIHAFEADHLLAVSNIVSKRNNVRSSMKDGIYWGLGHSSTIIIIGVLMIVCKAGITPQYFRYFEALVGLMLIMLAIYRLTAFFKAQKLVIHRHAHIHDASSHSHLHVHVGHRHEHHHPHSLAYGVGLVHGLAGSGALILIAMSQMKRPVDGLLFLVVFGAGCIVGMIVAAGLFSVPFSKKIIQARALQGALIVITALLCFLYGGKVIYDNLIA